MYEIPSQRFFRFAYRLPAYRGVMRARAEEESDYDEEGYRPKREQRFVLPPTEYQQPELHPITYEN